MELTFTKKDGNIKKYKNPQYFYFVTVKHEYNYLMFFLSTKMFFYNTNTYNSAYLHGITIWHTLYFSKLLDSNWPTIFLNIFLDICNYWNHTHVCIYHKDIGYTCLEEINASHLPQVHAFTTIAKAGLTMLL